MKVRLAVLIGYGDSTIEPPLKSERRCGYHTPV